MGKVDVIRGTQDKLPLTGFLFSCLKTCDSYYRVRVVRDSGFKDLLGGDFVTKED